MTQTISSLDLNQRLPDETERQWFAYCCYRELPPPRTLQAAWYKYTESDQVYRRTERKARSRVQPSNHFRAWSKTFEWDKRVEEYDREQEARRREKAEAQEDAVYLEQLEEFRKTQLNAGKTGLAIALTVKNKLVKFLKEVDDIKSWKEAEIAARLLSAVEDKSSEQWAKALHVNLLLEEMMKSDG